MSYLDTKQSLQEAEKQHYAQLNRGMQNAHAGQVMSGQDARQSGEIQQEIQLLHAQLDRLMSVADNLYRSLTEVLDQQEPGVRGPSTATPLRASPLGRTLQELNVQLAQRIEFLQTISEGVRL